MVFCTRLLSRGPKFDILSTTEIYKTKACTKDQYLYTVIVEANSADGGDVARCGGFPTPTFTEALWKHIKEVDSAIEKLVN